MKNIRIVLIFILSLTAHRLYAQPAEKLDSLFNSLVAKNKFNGNVLIAEKGKIIYQKIFGIANEATGEKLNENSVFELASVSKQFTAMAIMMLKERGKLSLEDSIGKYIPELKFYGNVTIRNLLNHTGGLPDYMQPVMERALPKRKIATNKDIIRVLSEENIKADFAPGTKYEYSNTGYALLGSIIEKLSGMSYGKFLQKNIFKPLGMKNSLVYTRRLSPAKINNYAYGYIRSAKEKKMILPDDDENSAMVIWLDGIVGDGTVNSTAPDLLKWDRALYTNKLVSEKTKAEIFAKGILNNGKKTQYGMGWFLDSNKNFGRYMNHSGSWPGYVTFIEREIDADKTIIILQNHSAVEYPIDKIRKILYGEPLQQKVVKRQEVVLPIEKLEEYVGEYELQPEYSMKIFLDNDKLKTQLTGQNAFELFAEAKDKFFLKVVDAQLEFTRDAKGNIQSAILHQNGNDIEAIKLK